jgi:hypothetical protein
MFAHFAEFLESRPCLATIRLRGIVVLGKPAVPLWAILGTFGQRESSAARLKEAVEKCRTALEERTRLRVPPERATTQC